MSTSTAVNPNVLSSPGNSVEHEVGQAREAVLHQLLPINADYEFAKDNGLIDMFYYDPETGEDGLIHTLSGNYTTGKGGEAIPQGFHHGPSAEAAWPTEITEDGKVRLVTRVDSDHQDNQNSDMRKRLKQWPFEPFNAYVTIGGLKKVAVHTDSETGDKKVVPAQNSMFPSEYDALAVMQTIRIARENRDVSNDRILEDESTGRKVIINDSMAPLIDGESMMTVHLVLDAESEMVLTATPRIPRRPGTMKLTAKDAEKHIYGE